MQQGKHLIFPSAEEGGKRVTALIVKHVLKLGAVQQEILSDQLPTPQITSHRWVLDMLPKGKKMKPFVSEFQSYKFFLVNPSMAPFSRNNPKEHV